MMMGGGHNRGTFEFLGGGGASWSSFGLYGLQINFWLILKKIARAEIFFFLGDILAPKFSRKPQFRDRSQSLKGPFSNPIHFTI